MGFPERHAAAEPAPPRPMVQPAPPGPMVQPVPPGQIVQPVPPGSMVQPVPRADRGQSSQEIRYGRRRGSNHLLHDPAGRRRPPSVPPALPVAPDLPPALPVAPALPPGRLVGLLGRSVLEAGTQAICREYGVLPRFGAGIGSGLSRSYQAREHGIEVSADAHGTITTIFLHFHGDDGFRPYLGEIPGWPARTAGGAGFAGGRTHLRAALGRPAGSGDPRRDRFLGDQGPWDRWRLATCLMHAQYALDGETLRRLALHRGRP